MIQMDTISLVAPEYLVLEHLSLPVITVEPHTQMRHLSPAEYVNNLMAWIYSMKITGIGIDFLV